MIGLDSGVIKVSLSVLFFLAFCLGVDVLIPGSGVQIPFHYLIGCSWSFLGCFGFGGAGSHDWT